MQFRVHHLHDAALTPLPGHLVLPAAIAGMVVWMMAEGSGLIFDRDRVLLFAGIWLLAMWGHVLTGMLLAGGCV